MHNILLPGDVVFHLHCKIVRNSLLFKLEELKLKLGIGADVKPFKGGIG